MRRLVCSLSLVAALGVVALARGQDEKRSDLYDEKAQGAEQISTALAKAKLENRRVLIQWGANW